MALSGLLRSKLPCLIVTPCSKQTIVKLSLPTVTSAFENYDARKGLNYMQFRGRRKIHIPELKPINFRSGDVPIAPTPVDEILYKYQHIEGIKDYPVDLKKQFTIEYATEAERTEHQHMQIQEKLSAETGPGLNYEKLVAYLTVKIRFLMVKAEKKRQNKRLKHYTFQRIAKRNKFLNYLKREHKQQYEMLIKELKIEHQRKEVGKVLTHRQRRFQNVIDKIEEQKQAKRDALEKMFADEKKKFMEYKKKVIKEITADAKEYSIDMEEVEKTFKKEQKMKQKALEAKPVKMGIMFVKWHEEEIKRKEKQLKIIPNPYVLGLKK